MKDKSKGDGSLSPNDDIELTDKEMRNLMVELTATRFWHAIKRFNREIDAHAVNSISTVDPFKDPTALAKAQGMRAGIYLFEDEAMRELLAREEQEKGTDVK